MTLFPSASKQTSTPAPTRSAREACWEHRDLYFACLDQNSIAVPGTEVTKDGAGEVGNCDKYREVYGRECAASWVDYFNKRRVLQLRQDLMEKKAQEQRESGGPITGEKVVPVGGTGGGKAGKRN